MRSGYQIFGVCLVTFMAGGPCTSATAAEDPVVAQDLVNVRASASIAASLWTRRPDSYTLQVAFPAATGCGASAPRANPPPAAVQQPSLEAAQQAPQDSQNLDGSLRFIGSTIANLRGLDPTFGCRTLFLVEGRRVVPATSPPVVSRAVEQPAPQKPEVALPKRTPSVQAWLLRADGSLITPVAVSTEVSYAYGCKVNCPVSGKQYRFSLAEGEQAVAVAINVDDEYYIEKLKTLATDAAPPQ